MIPMVSSLLQRRVEASSRHSRRKDAGHSDYLSVPPITGLRSSGAALSRAGRRRLWHRIQSLRSSG